MSFAASLIEHKREVVTTTLTAIDDKDSQEKLNDMGILIDEGRGFFDNEKNVMLVGSSFAKARVFEDELGINDYLKINGEKFRIIGIMQEIGSPPEDSALYITLDDFNRLTGAKKYNYLALKVRTFVDQAKFANELETQLIRRLNIDAFSVSTPDKILEQVNDILDTVKIVVVGIAIISLIVGAVGISNSMFTSVLERRKQIGVMKAVGATNNNIIIMFLIEAGMIGLMGSIIGLFFGSSISLLISEVANQLGYKILVRMNPILIIGLLIFSLLVGIFSGLFPAIEASKLPPSESIRSY
jgi:putative ABC transport system permease protein